MGTPGPSTLQRDNSTIAPDLFPLLKAVLQAFIKKKKKISKEVEVSCRCRLQCRCTSRVAVCYNGVAVKNAANEGFPLTKFSIVRSMCPCPTSFMTGRSGLPSSCLPTRSVRKSASSCR